MDKITKFVQYINEKTENKYAFLKLKSIVFDMQKNVLNVEFIYPQNETITKQDREKLHSTILC